METLWFCLVAVMLTGYVILDGFDLGAGVVSLVVARGEEEKRRVLKSIGPFWDGNEVWLLAGGGTLYFAFPGLYASSFSGFYLPLMMVLWLLMLRGIAIELRNHIESPVWKPLWDVVFGGASALLAIFYGAALGNVVRGVPLDPNGDFFLPLWTHWGISGRVGVLDWYTVLVGVLAFVALTAHGALWVNLKTSGELQRRTQRMAAITLALVAVLTALVTAVTFATQPLVPASYQARPWGWIFPGLAVGGLATAFLSLRQGREARAFLASCVFLLGMMTSAAFGVFPYVLPSNLDGTQGLTIYNTAAAGYGLRVGLVWFLPGMALALGYTWFLYRRFAGKVESYA
jgi:cytochrome d ubiquinol oxidase subunit II